MVSRAEAQRAKDEIDRKMAEGDLQPSDLTPREMMAALHRLRRRMPSSRPSPKVAPEGLAES